MKKYYLHDGEGHQGPFDIKDLKERNILAQTPIWHEGLDEWTTADKIEELKSLFSTTPPPFSVATQPVITKLATQQRETYYKPAEKASKVGKYALIFGGLLVLGGLYIANENAHNNRDVYEASEKTYQEKVMSVEEIEKAQPTKFLSADGNYNENFWGNKIKVRGKITNKATVTTYKDAVVRIIYYSKTKTELGNKEYTIYESFLPNTTTNFQLKIENYKDVNSIDWEVVSAKSY